MAGVFYLVNPFRGLKMKKIAFIAPLLLTLTILIGACSSIVTPGTKLISLTDGMDREVKLSAPAQRIVSLAPSNTEILFALGAADQVVGRDEFSNYPSEVTSIPGIGGSMGNYNFEKIAALKPDLVLASSLNTPEQVKSLEELGITVYLLPNPVDLDGLYKNLGTVGTLIGKTSQADNLIEDLKSRVSAVEDKISVVDNKPVVFYELDASDAAQPWTSGPGTFLSNLIGMAGGINAGDELSGDFVQISLETLLVKNPDLIILGDSNYGVDIQQVASRTGWETLGAVKTSRVYPFNDDLVSRPGPRLVDGLEALAQLIHPEAFDQ
jgi:iron complex transport system substrate-binding protein